jgi:hypothetical protein
MLKFTMIGPMQRPTGTLEIISPNAGNVGKISDGME